MNILQKLIFTIISSFNPNGNDIKVLLSSGGGT
jgi:hypothetical protein